MALPLESVVPFTHLIQLSGVSAQRQIKTNILILQCLLTFKKVSFLMSVFCLVTKIVMSLAEKCEFVGNYSLMCLSPFSWPR